MSHRAAVAACTCHVPRAAGPVPVGVTRPPKLSDQRHTARLVTVLLGYPDGPVVDDGHSDRELSPDRLVDLAAAGPAGPNAVGFLAGALPSQVSDLELVEQLKAWQAQVNYCQARLLETMRQVAVRSRGCTLSAAAEVAAALRTARPAAEHELSCAKRLAGVLPKTRRLFTAGRITLRHALAIHDETLGCDAGLCAAVEDLALARAPEQTVGQFRSTVKQAVAALDPDGFAARHAQRSRDETDVQCAELYDGMSQLWATGSTADTALIKQAVDAWADGHRVTHPDLTVGQRRVQALACWARDYLAGPDAPTRHGRPVNIDVVIDLPTLLGLADHPGEVVGYGLVPAVEARRLAASGAWRRPITDPRTGHLLDCGRSRYRPDQPLVDFLLARERVSGFPGATTRSEACDIDHTVAYEDGGGTGPGTPGRSTGTPTA